MGRRGQSRVNRSDYWVISRVNGSDVVVKPDWDVAVDIEISVELDRVWIGLSGQIWVGFVELCRSWTKTSHFLQKLAEILPTFPAPPSFLQCSIQGHYNSRGGQEHNASFKGRFLVVTIYPLMKISSQKFPQQKAKQNWIMSSKVSGRHKVSTIFYTLIEL